MLNADNQDHTKPIQKVPTQIKGLDEILHGGIPKSLTTVIVGGPGTGKTVMGMEYLYKGALNKEKGVFISFEERSESLKTNCMTLGWDLSELEDQGTLYMLTPNLTESVIISNEFSIDGLLAMLKSLVNKGVKRICIDALDAFLGYMDDPENEKKENLKLHQWIHDNHMTAIMSGKRGLLPALKTVTSLHAPLRTVHVTFTTYGSSISKAFFKTRFSNCQLDYGLRFS